MGTVETGRQGTFHVRALEKKNLAGLLMPLRQRNRATGGAWSKGSRGAKEFWFTMKDSADKC